MESFDDVVYFLDGECSQLFLSFVEVANLFSTSRSHVLSCGVNTSVKCLENISAFSSSLLARGPGGFEFVRIGGFGIFGFLRDLNVFQIEWSEHFRVMIYSV